jgi:hypothetical protein
MGGSLSNIMGGTAAPAKPQKQRTLKRKHSASPMKFHPNREANPLKFDYNGVPYACTHEARFDLNAAYFQLRKGPKATSDFTDIARQNIVREFAVAKVGGSTTGSSDSVLEHYTTTVSAIKRWQKALAAKASTDGDKTNCAMTASIEIKHSLPKMKPCPDKENRHPNKLLASKPTPPPKRTSTPKKTAAVAPRLTTKKRAI